MLKVTNEPVPAAALRLLEIAERKLKPTTPNLPWDNVAMVRGWIRELVENISGS